jgi:hypothetical protein
MPNHDSNHLERAAEHWREGQPLETGRLLFGSVPKLLRSKINMSIVLGPFGPGKTAKNEVSGL